MPTIPRTILKAAAGVAAGGLIAVAAAHTASAHVTIAEGEAEAGAYTLLTFGVGHGCEGSPTTEVRIQMPETIPQVAPTINPGWDIEKVMTTLDEPIDAGHGEQLTERVSEVVYAAKTPLLDGYREAFVLSVKMPDDAAGETLYFPTIQTCDVGETAWIELPAEDGEEPESPAPSIAVVEASAGGEHGDEATANGTTDGATAEGASVDAGEGAAVASTGDDDDGSSNGLAIAALVAGIAGIGVGGVALARSGKR